MKLLTGMVFALLCFGACKENNSDRISKQQQAEIDSLKQVLAEKNKAEQAIKEVPKPEIEAQKEENQSEKEFIRAGKHSLTLQWISWDHPGSVDIQKIGENRYSVKGRQNAKRSTDYLKIDGVLEPINARELKFSGLVEHKISHIGGGAVCKKQGNYIFKATGTRKYWRMQDMANCYDGVTDYVDIYF